MQVIFDYPPLYDEIDARFGIAGKRVIFAWGERIYNPFRLDITAALYAHETMHGRRQGDDIEGWWRRYIEDDAFRLAEEIPAHAAEYLVLANGLARPGRRRQLQHVAKKLASPLYGRLTNPTDARRLIMKAAI